VNGTKDWWKSKTLWVNLILAVFAVLVAANVVDFELTTAQAEAIAVGIIAVAGVVNVILRYFFTDTKLVGPMRK
jgi:hypothetical protein